MKRKHGEDEPLMQPPLVFTADSDESLPPLLDVLADSLRLDLPALALATLLTPVPLGRLLNDCWGKRPLVVHRSDVRRPQVTELLSSKDIQTLLKEKHLQYGLNVDIATYDLRHGRRTLNDGENAATHDDVMRRFAEGCSVRILHPQRYQDALLQLVQALERFFSSPVGCNAYWTPASAQGFAPHYDDIDALVLQLEGEKRWRLYAPLQESEVLPRYSSTDFEAKDLGPVLAEVILKPGDMMYMPRGLIHEAFSLKDCHSLHVTISVGQRCAWVDFLELALPAALRAAAEEMPELRTSLPRRFFDEMGAMQSDRGDADAPGLRGDIIRWIRDLMQRICDAAPLDAAADQMAAAFQRTRAPPDAVCCERELAGVDKVRLAFAGCARLCIEEDSVVVYHPFNNARAKLMGGEANSNALSFQLDAGPVVEALLRTGPKPSTLEEVARQCDVRKRDVLPVASALARVGILHVM